MQCASLSMICPRGHSQYPFQQIYRRIKLLVPRSCLPCLLKVHASNSRALITSWQTPNCMLYPLRLWQRRYLRAQTGFTLFGLGLLPFESFHYLIEAKGPVRGGVYRVVKTSLSRLIHDLNARTRLAFDEIPVRHVFGLTAFCSNAHWAWLVPIRTITWLSAEKPDPLPWLRYHLWDLCQLLDLSFHFNRPTLSTAQDQPRATQRNTIH